MLNYLKNRPATETFYHHQKDNSLSTTIQDHHHFEMTTSTTSTTSNSTHLKNISPPSPAAIRVMCQPTSTVHESKSTIHSPISSSSSQHDDSDSSFSPSSNSSSSTHDQSHRQSRKNSITSTSSISKPNKTKKSSINKKHAKITSSSTHKSKYTPDSKKKSKIKIPVFELIRVMALPQSTAANCLGVSLSTLKRRYYELGIGRWPGQCGSITQDIDLDVPTSEKSKLSYLLNDENLDSARDLDQVTLSILNFTFKQTF
ncbi:predicted protein [Naegleria gruberi]|uniref:Predicted protein n=1 Tax=Naegleria gruberi TaxID=5762 RepID=D2VMY4_NAEGR|nr:uncharacterized protein NAEGRDRAFT_70306 [Naegleria gruberi]EFC41902.1 predicted protein [Naegleria gruberi]|eukprot:XP_002674646.1 predicted protein [Naegleria gruberi strain NEG-M]